MWKDWEVTVDGVRYFGDAKVYDLPSEWGIRCGRVSKCYINDATGLLWCYDRGWGGTGQAPAAVVDAIILAPYPDPVEA